MNEQTAEWTVMVFLNGDNNLEKYGLRDFREMAQVGSTDEVNVIVQFDRNGIYHEAVTTPEWSECLRFRVDKDMEPVPANALQDLGEVNMGDGRVLADFVRWATENFPARRYMLDIWDHGQGWRIARSEPVRGTAEEIAAYNEFRREVSAQEIAERSMRLAEAGARGGARRSRSVEEVGIIPAGRVVESTYRSISTDDTSHDQLYNRELQDSLLGALNGDKLDLIGFDACLMAMVETGFAMRGVGKTMVASEELEPGNGWNYSDWLRYLVDDPGMDDAALGRTLVESYRRVYEDADSDVTLSAVDLSKMSALASLIDDLAEEMIQKMASAAAHIQVARQECREYGWTHGMHGIDLARFCSQLRGATQDASLREKAQAVEDAVRSCVLGNYAGAGRQGKYGSTGIAIYFPRTRALFNTDPDSQGYLQANPVYPVEFVENYRWDNFLQDYYRLVP